MNKKYIIITIAVIIVIIGIIVIGNLNKENVKENDNLKIVTSFYPMYIMTMNITNGVEDVQVSNMAENYVGCIHDYTLKTEDLKKFENANIFIENGYGMEAFSQKIIDSYPQVKIIESAKGITDVIKEESGDVNAHFWTSIDNYILQVQEIANQLSNIDSKNGDTYKNNANTYIQKLNDLKNSYEDKIESLKGKKVISLNESFSYLFKTLGIEEILIETDHEQSSLSAETVKNVIDKMNEENINSVIIAENDNEQNAKAIAEETGAKVYKLKDGMSGDNSLDSYINDMKYNFEIFD